MIQKVLVLHNRYQQEGGEDAVVASELDLLKRANKTVRLVEISNDDIAGAAEKFKVFLKVDYDAFRAEWIGRIIDEFRPDIVHVHNFFPLLTPSVHDVAVARGVAVVQTLHNFRMICSAATFLRDGAICLKCHHGSRLWGIFHRCYRGSLAGSIAVSRLQSELPTLISNVDAFIVLTEFAKHIFADKHIPPDKLFIKPNFVFDEMKERQNAVRAGALFVGRIAPEKGVDVLVEAWRNLPDIHLRIAGDGPELDKLKAIAPSNVEFLGRQSREQVRELMFNARCLIMPSLWFEGFPVTVVEAFSRNLPIIASKLGSLEEIVEHGYNGFHFAVGDSLSLQSAVSTFFANRDAAADMQKNARETFERRYSPGVNIGRLLDIYEKALDSSSKRSLGKGSIG